MNELLKYLDSLPDGVITGKKILVYSEEYDMFAQLVEKYGYKGKLLTDQKKKDLLECNLFKVRVSTADELTAFISKEVDNEFDRLVDEGVMILGVNEKGNITVHSLKDEDNE